MTTDPHESPATPEASAPPARDASPLELSPDVLGQLARAERLLYARIIIGAVLFCAFAALDVSAALAGKMEEQGGLLLVLLVAAILALPRQVFSPRLLEQVPVNRRKPWLERTKRIQHWLVWARLIFFLSALFLFLGLPKLV